MVFAVVSGSVANEVARAVSEGIAEGLKQTAQTRPDQWLSTLALLGVVALVVVYMVICRRGERAAAREHNQLVVDTVNACHVAMQQGRGECHQQARDLAKSHEVQTQNLGKVAEGLAVATVRLEGATGDLTDAVARLERMAGGPHV